MERGSGLKAMRVLFSVLLILGLSLGALAQEVDSVRVQTGVASYYGKRFHQRKTANGEIFNMDSLTAAHKYLPFNTWVKVTRLDTQDSVWVRINDRLPKTSKRIIDLSRRAGTELDMREVGVTKVSLQVGSINEMNALYSHFGGEPPGTLRLRMYEQPIRLISKPKEWCWNLGC